MLKNLRFKTLSFYVFSIIFVLILFKIVTNYGENHLEAPPPISGNYLLNNLQLCPKSQTMTLMIQQSGIYLSGSLLATEDNINPSREKPFLWGKWQHQELNLVGQVSHRKLCGQFSDQSDPNEIQNIKLKASLANHNLQGNLDFNPANQSLTFTAKRVELLEHSQRKN